MSAAGDANVNSNEETLKISGKNLPRLGGRFILQTQIGAQILSTLVGPIPGLYFIYVTAELSQAQLVRLLLVLGITLIAVNILHATYAWMVSRQARDRLDHLFKHKRSAPESSDQSAWNEVIAFPRRSAFALLILLVLFIIVPLALYMRWVAGVSLSQIIYLVVGGTLSAIIALILSFLFIDTQLAPARYALLPAEAAYQEIQITFDQRTRQYFVTLALLLLAILTLGGISFQKITAMAAAGANIPAIQASFRSQSILLSIILLGIGIFVASRLVKAISEPSREISRIMEKVKNGDYTERAPIITSDDLARLTIHFNQMVDQLQTTKKTLENQVKERTGSLEQKSRQLQAAAQVAREAASLQDLGVILSRTVNLISEHFGYYHAGIFLLDEAGQYAILQAASSEGGKNMLARGHRLLVGQQGIVGAAAYHNQPRIAVDVGADREFFNNPDLPMTRSEAALPLTVHNQVIGVLDIQSAEESEFLASDIEVLQILADQVALAIQNARLFTESQEAIQRLEASTAENLRKTWEGRLQDVKTGYRYTSSGLVPISQSGSGKGQESDGANYLSIPINLRGQRIGTISLHRKGETAWSDADRSLANEVSAQVGLALENARLVQDTQLRAEREKTLSQMASKIRETLDIDAVLQTAVREIKKSFNLDKAEVRLQMTNRPDDNPQPRQS